MPTISYFYGIAIRMYYNDHNPPHFHAVYGRSQALIRIADAVVIAGQLPPTALRLVSEWTALRRMELEANWELGREAKPFEKIAGPDNE